MKKNFFVIQIIILLTISCLLLTSKKEVVNEEIIRPTFSSGVNGVNNGDLRIVVTSDIHFLSKKNTTPNSFINRPVYSGDGRIVVYNEELIDAFIGEMQISKPDVVLITGDLTIDGSYSNHFELSKKLEILVDEGIKVLVIPGNHDLNNILSRKYLDMDVEPIRQTTSKDFRTIYWNCGYNGGLLYDTNSLSYAYQVSNDLLFLMIDTCIYQDGNPYATSTSGLVKPETMIFMEKVLKYAQKHRIDVVSCMHHNLFEHSELFKNGFKIKNYQEIIELLSKYHVKLNLSGHMHIQHIVEEQPLTEILTSSLAVSYNQYGIIDYKPYRKIDYQTKIVDVSGYYQKNNNTNPDLLDFYNYSLNFFQKSSYDKKYDSIMFEDSSMVDYATACAETQKLINPAYFSGVAYLYRDEVLNSPYFSIWNKYPYERTYQYFWSIINETRDHTKETINLIY